MTQYRKYAFVLGCIFVFAFTACETDSGDETDNGPDGGDPGTTCADDPCVNATDCENTDDGYECTCETDWGGVNCDVDLTSPTTKCVITYALTAGNGDDADAYTGANMRIRDTMGGLGNDTYGVGPGTLIIRVPSDGLQEIDPDGGVAEILYYELAVSFTTTTGGEIVTSVTAASPEAGQNTNSTAQALGPLDMTGTPSITWEDCTYPDGYNDDENSFTADVEGTGDGCLAPYKSVGTVTCNAIDAICGIGNLNVGENPQYATREQKLEYITFSSDLCS